MHMLCQVPQKGLGYYRVKHDIQNGTCTAVVSLKYLSPKPDLNSPIQVFTWNVYLPSNTIPLTLLPIPIRCLQKICTTADLLVPYCKEPCVLYAPNPVVAAASAQPAEDRRQEEKKIFLNPTSDKEQAALIDFFPKFSHTLPSYIPLLLLIYS